MKLIIPLITASLLFGCSSTGWKSAESVNLDSFKAKKGVHCESSAMLNMLNYEGYGLSEAQIIGGGAILGFMYELSEFPFLGGRTLAMKEHFFKALDIKWHSGTEEEYGDGWGKIHSLLQEGHPIVLRVDMRYLPYLYGGKYGSKYMSFGWHMICISGIDAEKQTASVTDTAQNGLQTIKLKDLHKARFSDTEIMPPHGEFYWVEKAPSDFNPVWESVALGSLKLIESEMRAYDSDAISLAALDGLSRFPETLAKLDKQVPPYLLSPVLFNNYGSIETNGTGGAAFRKIYLEFLETTAGQSGNQVIIGAGEKLRPAAEAWTRLANGMRWLSEQKSILKDKEQLSVELSRLSETADAVYEAEKNFYDYIQNHI